MRFYVATAWAQRDRARTLAGILTSWGHVQTFDWTRDEHGTRGFPEIAETEINAVALADVLVVLLPGERGTHTEMGAALALDKPVILWSENSITPDGNRTCPFHWHRNVTRVSGSWPELVKWLERQFGEVGASWCGGGPSRSAVRCGGLRPRRWWRG